MQVPIKENLDDKVESIMIGKTKLVYGIVVGTLVIAGLFFKIQLDVALIKQNHEAHMQAALEKIASLEKDQSSLMVQLNTDHDAIIRLLQMHEK